MKKILSLFSLLLLFVVGASAEKVTYALAVDETHKAGESVDVKNGEDVVATLTFGFAGEADFNKAVKDASVEGFEAYTSGNGVNGAESAGTNYIIVPKYDGKVSAAVVLNANKSFFVTEDGTALEAYNGIKKDAKYYGTIEFDVKAGKTYKVYCTGSKLGFYGFTYEFEAAAQPIKFDVTYALAVDETHKAGESVDVMNGEDVVATLTFGFAGEADFNKAAKDGSVEGFEAYTSGNGVNGSEKAGSNYIIVPKYDGKVSAAVVLNANKSFFVTEDGTALEAYNGIKKDAKYYGTIEFDVKAGKTYKVYCTGSKLGFYGFTYSVDIAGEEDPDENLTFAAYTSLDFNSAVNGAVSRGGRHKGDLTTENAAKEGIALPFVINAADATLTIAPNEDATNYPEGSEPCSKFIETVAGPQLLISGGYSGATLTLDKTTTDFNEIKLNLTNWSKKMTAKATNAGADVEGIFDPATGVWKSKNAGETADKIVFTVQADTTWVCESKFKPKDPKKPDGDQVYDGYKLIEVVNHDMGIVKINSIEINPVYDVIVDAADGTELSAAVAAATAAIKNPKSLIINLAAGGNYTVTNSITTAVPTTINGNGATIDASENSNNFLQMATISAPTEWVAADITIKDVTIKGLQKALFYSNSKNYIAENFIIDNCVVEQAADAITIDYTKGSTANITVTNSTFYAPTKTTKSFYSSQSAQKYTEYDASGVQTFKFHNNTMYNLAPTKNFFTHRQNSQKWLAYDVQNNIFVDCGKSGQVIKGFNGGGSSANPIWTVKGNVFNYGGADTSASESTGDADEPVEESIAGVVTFADAENGDFTQTLTTTAGDPRWIGGGSGAITGIEAVKEAKTAEDGAWYTIQGQRVAQPTKGLYIHNGKKVVIK